MSQSEQNKKIVQRFMEECWNRGNLNVASELLADQVRYHNPVFPNLNAGVQNIKQHIETCRRAFPDLHFTIDDTIAERDEVVLHWTSRGTHMGPFLGMQTTNRKFAVSGTSIYRVAGNKIVEFYVNWNLATMMAQLGIVELPKEAVEGAFQEQAKARG